MAEDISLAFCSAYLLYFCTLIFFCDNVIQSNVTQHLHTHTNSLSASSSKLSAKDDTAQLLEVAILRSLNPKSFNQTEVATTSTSKDELDETSHDNGIINLVDFYPSPKTYHIVMELARGGDVFDRLAKRKVYTEKDARDLAFRMLESIKFLHEKGIAHRDIKPENLLLMNESDTSLKLADFGFARRFSLDEPDTSMKTKCGTPSFVPPELVLGVPYGPKCDIWSCGCTLFMLLSGRAPFNSRKGGKNAMFRKIRAGDFVFYEDMWQGISINARKLVLSMMQVDPKVRVSAEEALQSDWINTDDSVLRQSVLEKSLKEIVSFNARRKLKGAMNAVRYAVATKFWDVSAATMWRENEFDSDRAIDGTCSDLQKEQSVLDGADPPTFEKLYTLDEKLQLGRCCVVWSGKSKETDSSYAIKVVDRTAMDQSEDATVLNEVSLLKSLRHPNIVKLFDFFETPERFYIVMQKCSGDVLDRVVGLKRYTESDARQLANGLIKGVKYLHERKIAHRDLKPQNLLLENSDDNTSVKICDFGFAKRVHVPQSLTTLCGSKHYVAPELLKNHPYDESADMWSVGVIVYFLLSGYLPFNARDQQDLFQLIRLGKYNFESKYWAGISDEAMDLIERLLEVDPASRVTAKDALESDWIQGLDDEALLEHELRGSLAGITETRESIKGNVRMVQWINKSKKMCSSLTMTSEEELEELAKADWNS